MTDGQKLSGYVTRELSEKDLSVQWEDIERRLATKRPPRRTRAAIALSFAAALAGVAVVFAMHRHSTPSAWDGALVDSGADHVAMALGDGSHIDLMPASQVSVVEGSIHSVRLELRKGSARFDVTHVPGRSFSVKSGNVTIRVVGTRFSVERAEVPGGVRVTVAVERGVVEAESAPGAEPTRVRAGETWSTVASSGVKTKEPEPSPGRVAPTSAPEPSTRPSPRPEAVAHPPAAPAEKKSEPTAQELFESGNAARQAGDARGAAASYEALLRQHPGDARAGLAAFELGRLKMDQLGDVRGAVVALKRAVATAPSSGFREDALARLVSAYATLGKFDSCERMRSAYLGSYPNGVHATAVRQACGNGR